MVEAGRRRFIRAAQVTRGRWLRSKKAESTPRKALENADQRKKLMQNEKAEVNRKSRSGCKLEKQTLMQNGKAEANPITKSDGSIKNEYIIISVF